MLLFCSTPMCQQYFFLNGGGEATEKMLSPQPGHMPRKMGKLGEMDGNTSMWKNLQTLDENWLPLSHQLSNTISQLGVVNMKNYCYNRVRF